jgi:cytochrome c biogenesis protein CcdA
MSERNEFSSQMQSLFRQVEEQQQQIESQRKRRERRKRLGLTAAVFALGLATVLVYLGYPSYQEATRRRVANQFIRAVERGDGETLCTLVTS